jgi:peptidoglycan/xylan/chitin deacetylase (PgdA/CDA1 family)
LNNRVFNIFSIVIILLWIWADRYFQIGSAAYAWLLLAYVSVLFCGSYFIQLNFFLKSVNKIKTDKKCIALTFDDGPAGSKTAQVLDILKANNAEAAFFCIGSNIAGNEDILKRIPDEGHIIGNHSFSHHHFFDLFSSRKMLNELQKMSQTCYEVTGLLPRFFRPPYGVTNPNLKKAILQAGFISVGWSIRSYDTVIKNEDRLRRKILSALRPGSILLLHDTSETTLAILPGLLKSIKEKGYSIVRLDKMTNLNPYD